MLKVNLMLRKGKRISDNGESIIAAGWRLSPGLKLYA
jgi:hypothetical protein